MPGTVAPDHVEAAIDGNLPHGLETLLAGSPSSGSQFLDWMALGLTRFTFGCAGPNPCRAALALFQNNLSAQGSPASLATSRREGVNSTIEAVSSAFRQTSWSLMA